ncbi:uncharacterized protein LOC132901830 [Amyelois transitella]|uniref:uncharacterized protein LOC132901830 n=1 Tax=Amyelois transitella TaxID=680683 RepID=UPI00299030D4|nr:uncharacterized protein LOC132901830 [Amyelois transitella]
MNTTCGATKPPDNFRLKIHSGSCNEVDTISNICNCPLLAQTDTHKYLGIIIDQNLNWAPHITFLSKRVRKLIYLFKNLRESADLKLMIRIYYALCQSLLTYCIPVWGGAGSTHLLDLERAQRAVIKVMLKKPRLYPTDKLYKESGLLSVRQLFIFNSVLRHHKTIDPSSLVSQNRRQPRPRVPSYNLQLTRSQTYYSGPFLYRYFNDNLRIFPMCRTSLKTALNQSLKTLTYDSTEQLLKPVI